MNDRPLWDFEYAPIAIGRRDDGSAEHDLVLATEDDVDTAKIAELLATMVPDVELTPLFSAHPIFWTRLRSTAAIDRHDLVAVLEAHGIKVRYAAAARRGSQQLAPPLDVNASRARRAADWRARAPTVGSEPSTPWRWFLRANGADVTRSLCGTGAGTRLAVIDNDGRDLDKIDLDAVVPVGVDEVPRAGAHAGLLLGWAVGARSSDGHHFRGVAPDASPRVYCIPKAADEIICLPLAIVRAVDDGADVIVCATSVEGQSSPLLDDALAFATCLGRGGKGAAVVMPTGREMSSPADSVHSSLSLGLGDPASDPRVFCVGPSSRDGGWFLWRDRHGKIRPFANRGPAVRWLAPGDDLAYPFSNDDRPAHAESSGASAVAAGVLLLVLGRNPTLKLGELDTLLHDTIVGVEPAERSSDPELGDRADLLPLGRDADGHNAKHGYGRLSATQACLAASDPICATLIRIGAREAAERYEEARPNAAFYSKALARWAARTLLHDSFAQQAMCSFARAARLGSRRPNAAAGQPPGYWVRHLGMALRLLVQAEPPRELVRELIELDERIRGLLADETAAIDAERQLLAFASRLFDHHRETRGGRDPSTTVSRLGSEARSRVKDAVLSERESASR
jgi:hypothetical protein